MDIEKELGRKWGSEGNGDGEHVWGGHETAVSVALLKDRTHHQIGNEFC